MKKAVILLSGGIDSTYCLALAKQQGFACYTLSFDYGQSHRAELIAAAAIAEHYEVMEHKVIEIPSVGALGGSALTDINVAMPEFTGKPEITSTYVPARNTIFLSIALGWAELLGANDIFIGVCAADFHGFPDCRPEYIAAFNRMANLATEAGVKGQALTIHTPCMDLPKPETLQRGVELGIDFSQTVTCYQATADGLACGVCESCGARKQAFITAGLPDVTRYITV